MTTPEPPAVWRTLLGDVTLNRGELLLYLDPHSLDTVESRGGETVTVSDRWELRRLLEQRLHVRRPLEDALLVHVRIPDLTRADELPFDASRYARRVLDVRLPPQVLDDVRNLPPRAVEQLTTNRSLPERLASVARELSGLSWPPAADTAITAVARLLPHLGAGLRGLLLSSCPAGAASDILGADEPFEAVASLLEEWSRLGSNHPDDAGLRAAGEDLSRLVSARQISVPVTPLQNSLPRVLREAVRDIDALPEISRLLGVLPASADTLESWTELANQWARIRWALAALPPSPPTAEVAATVWESWETLDEAWQPWLRAHYGTLLSRNVLRLASVHRVAPFLAAHVIDSGSKVLLLVLDGLGVAQWQQIVQWLGVTPIEDRRVLACLPTMTTVSRQAIFAGQLPTTFADTVDRTDLEPSRWRTFWTEYGLGPQQVNYQRTYGSTALDWQDPPTDAVATGMAVNAIDDLMHGVSLNGDHQFHAGVTTWLGGGFLTRALEWAARSSTQIWVTSDHGNLPCVGLGMTVPDEGVRVIGRGLRSRMYSTDSQRGGTSLPGLQWTPPCFPQQAGAPLFAPGRTYFRRSGGVITHGGLSLDEVVVPLARIA